MDRRKAHTRTQPPRAPATATPTHDHSLSYLPPPGMGSCVSPKKERHARTQKQRKRTQQVSPHHSYFSLARHRLGRRHRQFSHSQARLHARARVDPPGRQGRRALRGLGQADRAGQRVRVRVGGRDEGKDALVAAAALRIGEEEGMGRERVRPTRPGRGLRSLRGQGWARAAFSLSLSSSPLRLTSCTNLTASAQQASVA